MQIKKESHIQKQRTFHARNRKYIVQVLELDASAYNTLLFDTGVLFLEHLYPRDTTYESYYKKVAYDSRFWNWFTLEWKKWESELIDVLKLQKEAIAQEDWQEEMQQMALDGWVERSFNHNYLKG